ncbi:hypothetical protein [Streptomyces sp. CA-253872]|uniref:hypothetical protein n=1 Tax=Streptomyces sp. CA-253872 TaxID=3240067 RepID=UPI003D8BAE8B
MRKTFARNTEPHVADLGDGTELLFQPEILSDDFMDAFVEMREEEKQRTGVDVEDVSMSDVEAVRAATSGVRTFLSRLMLPESAELLLRAHVERDGKRVQLGKADRAFATFAEAKAYADSLSDKGGRARAVWALRMPDRVLMEMLDWTVELYSGGRRPPTSSGASAGGSKTAGTRGTGASRSKGSTRARGR